MKKIATPYGHINIVIDEIRTLQEGYDILEKLYVFYHMSNWDLQINGKPVDAELKKRLRNYFEFDDSE
jgi:hypothetical protein